MARELFSHSAEERARSTRQGRGRPVFCRFPSPSGQKNSCGVNAHKNGALRQIPAALCIQGLPAHGPDRVTVPPETAHSLFRCFCAAKKRPPAPQQAFSFRIPAFCRMPSIQHNPPLAPTTNGGPTPGSDFPIPLTSCFHWITVRTLGETSGESKTLVTCQSIKHQVHADVCSGSYQSTLVWLILVRNVSSLGTCRSYAYFEEFLDSERRWGLDLGNLLS